MSGSWFGPSPTTSATRFDGAGPGPAGRREGMGVEHVDQAQERAIGLGRGADGALQLHHHEALERPGPAAGDVCRPGSAQAVVAQHRQHGAKVATDRTLGRLIPRGREMAFRPGAGLVPIGVSQGVKRVATGPGGGRRDRPNIRQISIRKDDRSGPCWRLGQAPRQIVPVHGQDLQAWPGDLARRIRRAAAAGGAPDGRQKWIMMSPAATTSVLRSGATPVFELPLNAAWLAA